MKKIIKHITLRMIVSVGGLYLSGLIIPRVCFDLKDPNIIMAGLALGVLNLTLRSILRVLTFPLRIITLGLFGLIINGVMIWIITAIFPMIDIPLILPLVYTTLIMLGLNLILTSLFSTK